MVTYPMQSSSYRGPKKQRSFPHTRVAALSQVLTRSTLLLTDSRFQLRTRRKRIISNLVAGFGQEPLYFQRGKHDPTTHLPPRQQPSLSVHLSHVPPIKAGFLRALSFHRSGIPSRGAITPRRYDGPLFRRTAPRLPLAVFLRRFSSPRLSQIAI